MYYRIAGINIKFTGNNNELIPQLRGFSTFVSPPSKEDITIEVTDKYESNSENTPVYSYSDNDFSYSSYSFDDERTMFNIEKLGTDFKLSVSHKKGDNIATIGGNIELDILLFATWLAYGIMVLPLNRIAIHSSTIEYKAKAVLCLGESGTGKSTHTRLWRENIEGASLLNDDSPIIEVAGDKIYAHGSPWSGKTPCYKDRKVELIGAIRLAQAPYNKIEAEGVFRAFTSLYPSCPPAFAPVSYLNDQICDIISEILSKIKVWHLDCLPDRDACMLSKKTIFNE